MDSIKASARSFRVRTDGAQQIRSFATRRCRVLKLAYLLFMPEAYSSRKSRKWPLILFLHGVGERSRNPREVARHGPPRIVENLPGFPFLIVSPQCPPGQIWSNDALIALLDRVCATCRVDPSRIYLTGLSMGGYGAWNLALEYPERFAAVAPLCGGGDPIRIRLAEPKALAALKNLPVWAFHGVRDTVIPISESERMVKALRGSGNSGVRLTRYPRAGHDCWTQTYGDLRLYEWFLSHRSRPVRDRRKPSV
jgi:predicted peptidase